ncbi:hypothetical protein PIB30_111684, partial [Stylosanthes scabra]|nr:hypothetical protein [Stylosanthes scabra]
MFRTRTRTPILKILARGEPNVRSYQNHPSLMKQKGLKPQNSSFFSSSSKRKKEQKERKEIKEMRVVVVVPPSGGRNFHTGAPIDAP